MAVAVEKGVYTVAGIRTPFGKYGGLLRDVLPEDLFATAAKAATKAGCVTPDYVETVNIGQVIMISQTALSPRHAALKSGIPVHRPVLGLNISSASAFNAIICSAQGINQALKNHNLKRLARFLGWSCVAVDPMMIGTAAIPAMETMRWLKATGLTIDDTNPHKIGIYIVAAKRTPFAKMGRAFKDVHPSELFAAAAREAFRAGHLAPDLVDTVNVGQVYNISGSSDGILTPRHSALKAGVPYDKPALGVNRLCGSGFQAMVNSAQDILLGSAQISVAGGTENMSAIPFLVRDLRFGSKLGQAKDLEDFMKAGSVDSYCNFSMAQTAENLAEMYDLKREQLDQFALKSQMKWKAGFENGAFEEEMAPARVTVDGKPVVVDKDDHPRANTTMESLSKLPVLFRKGGVGTVGNSTGVNDGAGVLILASEEAVKQHSLNPLVRLSGWSHAGVAPRVMGLGPVPAIRQLLDATGFSLDDMDMIEINEQFAAQALASVIELGLDQDKLNLNGGAIAIGHPAAASGARIAAHLTHELRRRGLKRGIGATCIGGGQGIALLLETV